MINRKKKSEKIRKKQKSKFDFSINQALIFSVSLIIVFTIVMIITYYKFQSVPDSLIAGFFAMFGLEGGYCTFLHKLKKDRQKMLQNEDDTEQIDEQDDGDLIIDDEGEY